MLKKTNKQQNTYRKLSNDTTLLLSPDVSFREDERLSGLNRKQVKYPSAVSSGRTIILWLYSSSKTVICNQSVKIWLYTKQNKFLREGHIGNEYRL